MLTNFFKIYQKVARKSNAKNSWVVALFVKTIGVNDFRQKLNWASIYIRVGWAETRHVVA